ncbi:MAG: LytTR family transcriptional regulator DNA-binding domain-containing protein [Ignavibacteriaceae bacterium]|jgi:two-component system LytT family response regulator|nr:LytTR family transcriptional regulator DNA-binding domain-containing protein [Ignavibacteriaceae bacterium]
MKSNFSSIIIDDEQLARQLVKKYLEDFPEVEVIAECENGFEGIKVIQEKKPDFIFLDIQMPKLSGFEMLELLENPPEIIFTTAYDQYAIKAFELNAVDYLLKPFSFERFKSAVTKILEKMANEKQRDVSYNVLLSSKNTDEKLDKILIKDGSKIHVIPLEEVELIEAQDDYVYVHTNASKYLKQKTMKYFEEHLDQTNFVRIHRSFIVASKTIKQIDLLEKESYQVTLHNGKKLPVSKTGYQKLKELFK